MNGKLCYVRNVSDKLSLCGKDGHAAYVYGGFISSLGDDCPYCIKILQGVYPKAIQEMSFTDKYSMSKEVLTKREHFAFEFAKIFLNNDIKRGVGDKIMGGARGLSNSSVMVADELIKALNKEK